MERGLTEVEIPLQDTECEGVRTMKDNAVNGSREELTGAKGRMEESRSRGNGGRDVAKLRRLRLKALLRELVDEEGRMEATEMLGVAYRTLVRAEETGQITGRMRDALHRLLGSRHGPDVARLKERVSALEGRVNEMAVRLHEAVAGKAQAEASPTVEGLQSSKRAVPRRTDPELVTEDPATDDADVYGEGWPLVEEWRRLRQNHTNRGHTLSWLTREQRLLTLELAIMEQHGLTLPPETQPLRGFGRRGQTAWRWEALRDTRRAMARRKMLRRLRRILTLGLWWR